MTLSKTSCEDNYNFNDFAYMVSTFDFSVCALHSLRPWQY